MYGTVTSDLERYNDSDTGMVFSNLYLWNIDMVSLCFLQTLTPLIDAVHPMSAC